MALEFACPSCGQKYKVAETLADKTISCRKCSNSMKIPSAVAESVRAQTSRPPMQSFGTPPTDRSRPPLQSFGSPPPPSRPRPAARPAPSRILSEDDLEIEDDEIRGMDDLEFEEAAPVLPGKKSGPADPYSFEEAYIPPRAVVNEDDEDALPGPKRVKARGGKSKKRLHPSGFWRRWAAAFIDGIIMNVLTFAIGFGIGFALIAGGTAPEEIEKYNIYFQLGGFVFTVFYFAILEGSAAQASFGKQMMHLRVATMDGEPPGFGRTFLRSFLRLWMFLLLAIPALISAVTVSRTGRGLHDMMAGTIVLHDG